VRFAALVDRDIFAGYKALIREVKSDLVGSVGADVAMERPAATLTMNEMTVIVLLVRPQSRDPACFAMLAPEHGLNPVIGIERRDNSEGDTGIAFGVTGFACKFNVDLPKLRRHGCVEKMLCDVRFACESLSGKPLDNAAALDYGRSAAAAASGSGVAARFLRFLIMTVISGTISRGSTPFKGWWITPDSCD
jgi:hypothetical protein